MLLAVLSRLGVQLYLVTYISPSAILKRLRRHRESHKFQSPGEERSVVLISAGGAQLSDWLYCALALDVQSIQEHPKASGQRQEDGHSELLK